MQTIVFTVTNSLNYDQRMHRICSSLQSIGYAVILVGVERNNSDPLQIEQYRKKRLNCFFQKGPLFYFEYNIRLLFFLLFQPCDVICAIDLDTILPVLVASFFRGKKRVYDAHEYFTEQKEVRERPVIQWFWKAIESFAVPYFKKGYTVNSRLAQLFNQNYGVHYKVIRNIQFKYSLEKIDNQLISKYILYQGAVNKGRCFEQLIPAMQWVDAPLWIVGEGNFMEQTKALIAQYQLSHKVFLKGTILPAALRIITQQAFIGITIFEREGVNQYYSLANRFFDYMMAGTPQLCVDYPLYAEIVSQYPFALLISDLQPKSIAAALNKLLADDVLYQNLRNAALEAGAVLNWENESVKLIDFYHKL